MNATPSTHPAGTHRATHALYSQPTATEPVPTRCRPAAGFGDLSMPDRNVLQAGAPVSE